MLSGEHRLQHAPRSKRRGIDLDVDRRGAGLEFAVALLRFQHRDVLVEDAHHVAGENGLHLRIGEPEVAHEAEEVVRRALGLGRRRAERHQVDLAAFVLAAGEVDAVARRHVLDDLPAVDVRGKAAGLLVERRRRPVEDPAREAHQPLLALDARRKLGD